MLTTTRQQRWRRLHTEAIITQNFQESAELWKVMPDICPRRYSFCSLVHDDIPGHEDTQFHG